jgi:hypothetical protein
MQSMRVSLKPSDYFQTLFTTMNRNKKYIYLVFTIITEEIKL